MKTIAPLTFLLFLFLLYSCDDGDMIVTDFNFDSDSELHFCDNASDKVLFVINVDPSEAIAINFNDEDFDGTFDEKEDQQVLVIPINASNQLVYRTFDSQVGKDYFCSGIPATEPQTKSEYRSKNGGNLYLTTTVIEEHTDSLSQITTKTFETFAEVRDVTLKNTQKDEEIVRERIQLGSFIKEEALNP